MNPLFTFEAYIERFDEKHFTVSLFINDELVNTYNHKDSDEAQKRVELIYKALDIHNNF